MSEPQQAPAAAAAAARKSFVAKSAGAIAGHSRVTLAVIVVLTLLVVGLYVYYHGVSIFGPYAAPRKAAFKGAAKGAAKGAGKGAAKGAGKDGSDSETERLIESINSH